MGDYSFIFIIAGLFLFIPNLTGFIICRKSRFRKLESEIIEEFQVSDLNKSIISLGLNELKEHGFNDWYFRNSSFIELNGRFINQERILKKEHDTHTIIAVLSPKFNISGKNEILNIEFISFFDQGKLLITKNDLNLHLFLMNTNVVCQTSFDTITEMLKVHLEKLSQLSLSERALQLENPEITENTLVSIMNNHIDSLIGKEDLLSLGEEGFVLTLKACFRRLKMIREFKKKLSKSKPNNYPNQEQVFHRPDAISKYIEATNYINEIPTHFYKGEIAISLLLSFIIAALSFGVDQNNLERTLIILGIILIHELGHALGMYLFGYKNIKIFFIPFLGGIAMGKKPEDRPIGEILMLLLGPIPGLIIGASILLTGKYFTGHELTEGSTIYSYATLSIMINAFNLLPVEPLDGGKIVHLLLFSRFPRFQAVFSVFSGLLLFLTFNPILFAIGIASIKGSRSQWKAASCVNSLRKQGFVSSLNQACEYLDTSLSSHYLAKFKGTKRIQFFNSIMNKVKTVPVAIVPSLVLMTIYLNFCITIPGFAYYRISEITEQNLVNNSPLAFSLPIEYSEMTFKESDTSSIIFVGDIPSHYYTEKEKVEMLGVS